MCMNQEIEIKQPEVLDLPWQQWQSQREETEEGVITKEFFPSVEGRLAVNLNLSPNVTIMTSHGNIRYYID
jgi:hypothetical protein